MVTRMRSSVYHRPKLAAEIDTAVPDPVDMTTPAPGQNVDQVRLAWVGDGVEIALVGQVAVGRPLIEMVASVEKAPVVLTDTVGEPLTDGLVYANAG